MRTSHWSKKLRRAGASFVFLAGLMTQSTWAEPAWPPDTFSCYYGPITEKAVNELKELDLVVIHPGKDRDNLDKEKVARLKATGKEKFLVGYVSVGEDDQPPGGPPLMGRDHSGPSFVGSDLEFHKAENGYPAQFLDQRKFLFGEDGFLQFGPNGKPLTSKGQDGHPDENGVWGSYYVKTDEAAWKNRVFSIMDELVETGVDGFFLDTVDTASPWGDYGWTAKSMLDFVAEIRARYPGKKIVANRGLFYLSQNDRYAELIDAVLFESLLTHYNWAAEVGDMSPWAKWHVKALDDDVIPSQKRTGLHLLVLDYLNPEQEDALALIQSDRTLLAKTPHSLSFSHPSLHVTGWTPASLLPEQAPGTWPWLEKMELTEGKPGEFFVEATFSDPIPKELHPDLRFTQRTEVKVEGAAELPPAQLSSLKVEGKKVYAKGFGLDKAQSYRFFMRLISRSKTRQTGFGWTSYQTKSSELPSQVTGLSASSVDNGVSLKFDANSLVAKSYRVYARKGDATTLLKETQSSPVLLDHLAIEGMESVYVVAVTAEGKEGYPSALKTVVRDDVTAPGAPGGVEVAQNGETTTFSWSPSDGASSYRLYVVPEGQTFRLPAHSSETEIEFEKIVPGNYKVFLTAVDDSGNQSRPGPAIETTIK